ncbi:MAG: ATP-binding protein, partial [Caldiserica bacterium]|nr:ATP-binding protein [Caldisericota bacterium]
TSGKRKMEERTSTCSPSETACPICGAPYRTLYLGGKEIQVSTCDCLKKEAEERLRERIIKEEKEARLKASGLTPRLLLARLENFEEEPGKERALKLAREFLDRWPEQKSEPHSSGILFWGRPGVGKSHLAAAIANDLLERGDSPLFLNVVKFLNTLRNLYREEESESSEMERATSADLLVLDDLGAEKPTDWAREKIYELVNSRYESLLPLIATTNLNLNSLEDFLGERTFGRLIEMCLPVEVGGEDRRLRIARLRASPSGGER